MEKHTPIVGNHVHPDQWKFGSNLIEDDGYSDDSFPGCEFRLPSGKYEGSPLGYELAVNIKVTGRAYYVNCPTKNIILRSRCKIEFVGDGAPSTFTGGWIYHK